LNWATSADELTQFARTQLFFVGGAPRSGTTWLQQMLASHPDVCCQGEGLFLNHLAVPLERMMAARSRVIEGKNKQIFGHTGGYPIASADDGEFLLGTAILLALRQQTGGKQYRAVGEKTPENAFFFPRLKRLFPVAKYIAIARDPRDVLASAWHFFAQKPAGDQTAAKAEFITTALPSLLDGARAMIAFGQQHPTDYAVVTYESLLHNPAPELARLFRLLGVSDQADLVEACVARNRFAAQVRQHASGDGAFFRKGVAGNWRATFSEDMNQQILRTLGWSFEGFGWKI
jgi:hypothetical protein